MKILILGANGMLGHALMNEFAADDIIVGDKPEFDITKTEDLRLKITNSKPEIIINAAAYTDVDGCESNKDECNLINGQSVGDLAKICKKLDITLIHYSTDYVFSGENENGYDESAQTAPLNVYGKSKELGEKLLQENCDKLYLIRTSWLYGRHGKNFVDKIIELSQKQDKLKIINDQIGNPTYVKDLAKATRQLILDKKEFGIYHRTNSGICNWYEFALKIKELTGFASEIVPISSVEYKLPAKRPKYSILINTKQTKLRTWQEALNEYLELRTHGL